MPKSKHRKKPKANGTISKDCIGTAFARRNVVPGALILDPEAKRLFVVTQDVLINQLRREAPAIAASFDDLCVADLRELSELMSKSLSLLLAGRIYASKQALELDAACTDLLLNASGSFTAAIQLLRTGYTLQPGIVLRSMLEALSTVLHLLQKPGDFPLYQAGKFSSVKSLALAKKALPVFGQIYGYFSENFTHIGQLHQSVHRMAKYSEGHEALQVNLGFLRLFAWLHYVTVELLFNDLVESPRYWHPVEEGYAYNPSETELKWMREFLGNNIHL